MVPGGCMLGFIVNDPVAHHLAQLSGPQQQQGKG
jgi:hypothetical protein